MGSIARILPKEISKVIPREIPREAGYVFPLTVGAATEGQAFLRVVADAEDSAAAFAAKAAAAEAKAAADKIAADKAVADKKAKVEAETAARRRRGSTKYFTKGGRQGLLGQAPVRLKSLLGE